MKSKALLFTAIATVIMACTGNATGRKPMHKGGFNIEKDLLLAQFDCKTDVDDLQSAAALVTLLSDSRYSKVKYHAVAGTYGIQDGLYVPPNSLFQLAFGDNWTDAHENPETAIEKVKAIAGATLANKGDIWIAEAGQSDFTARLIKAIQSDLPEVDISLRIHVVQHSDWNESVTSPENLEFVKANADYHKIPDGNVVGNGTPGFRSPDIIQWNRKITNPGLREIWQLAIDLSIKYNGKDGRYNNEAVAAGGLDFSDHAEVCWILGLQDIKDAEHFFDHFSH